MNNKKNQKKLNFKVIASAGIAITLIGIVGLSIGKSLDPNIGPVKIVQDSVSSAGKGINSVFKFGSGAFSNIINFNANAKKVKSLEKENQKLKNETIKAQQELEKTQSLTELKKSLNFIDEHYKAKSISASVVSKNDGNWYKTIVIGAGSDEGVKKESIVVNGKGLVGMVYEVSNHYSKVITLLDTKSSVSFQLSKDNNAKGVVTQNASIDKGKNYKEEGFLKGYMYDLKYNALQGDVVTTSGLGIFPQGIPIGEIEKVVDDKNNSLKNVVIKPYVDFKDLNDVVVIEPRIVE